jgi:hypothetical protein
MIKKRIASVFMLIVGCIGAAAGLFFVFMGVAELWMTLHAAQPTFLGWIAVLLGALMLAVSLLAVNRLTCIVWIDCDKKKIGRKGLLQGYRYEMKFCEIYRVLSWNEGRGGCWLVIVKDREQIIRAHGEGCVKGAYIQLEDNEKNREFIRTAWHGPIAKL